MDRHQKSTSPSGDLVYAPTARAFHWWTVLLVAIMIPLGFYMVWRGEVTKFDARTGQLYDLHKLLGFILLWLGIARLSFRFKHGAPPDEPGLAIWQKAAAHMTHWGIYALLIILPMLGWLGVSLYGARSIFGLFNLPMLAAINQDASAQVFTLHKLAAIGLCALVAAHIGAALFHFVILKDGVLSRMLPGLRRK